MQDNAKAFPVIFWTWFCFPLYFSVYLQLISAYIKLCLHLKIFQKARGGVRSGEILRDRTAAADWESHTWFVSLPQLRAKVCYMWFHSGQDFFHCLMPWISLSQHISSLSEDLPGCPDTCEIYNKMLLLLSPSLRPELRGWGFVVGQMVSVCITELITMGLCSLLSKLLSIL